VSSGANEYDVFLSYARTDDDHGAVRRLTDDIRAIFYQRTRRQIRIFVDRSEILTAQLWQERISEALHGSRLLLVIVTESYLGSEWCQREWDYFAAEERALPDDGVHSRIFQVYLHGEPKLVDPPATIQRWVRAIKAREHANLGGYGSEDEAYRERVSRLTDDLIETLRKMEDRVLTPEYGRDVEHHHMVTGYVKTGARFVALLAKAANVTIVGMTNEGLATMLQEALSRKRRKAEDPDSFWGSLRIVFLSDKLLNWVNDGRSEYPDPRYELSQRELAAGYGRRSIESLLRRSSSSKWQLFESNFFPPIAGALLEMPDGSRVVQLIIRRPQRRTQDHLYIEFQDQQDQYFAATFEDIVHNSSEVNRVVPIGTPHDGGFLCTGARFFQNVLVDGSRQNGWMPVVLIVTWWNRNGRAEPVLQLRIDANSSRELERLSHLAGYVYLDPYYGAVGESRERAEEFELPRELIDEAARNRIRMETGSEPPGDVCFVSTQEYLHADKEHLFFNIYSFELPGHFQFPQRAQMCHLSVEKLVLVRKNQALRNAIQLCRRAGEISPKQRNVIFEIAAMNLTLHNIAEIGDDLRRLARTPDAEFGQMLRELDRLEAESREIQRSGAYEIELKGLSGMQYREFFTMLMPLYAQLGIPGAAELLTDIQASKPMRHALERLASLYHEEDLMMSIPVEL
jgi:hypothetical protein